MIWIKTMTLIMIIIFLSMQMMIIINIIIGIRKKPPFKMNSKTEIPSAGGGVFAPFALVTACATVSTTVVCKKNPIISNTILN